MASEHGQIPPGPQDECRTNDDLLSWMDQQFRKFGDIYKASLFGTSVYAIRDPEFAHHVLVGNWQNYVKGQFIKRVAFLLGNGLMVSEGELWKRQRRMSQPAFHGKPIGALTKLIATVNSALLMKWQLCAERRESFNATRDISGMVLEVVLRSILSDDYEQIGFHFNILTEEPARDLAFAESFRALGKPILEVVDRRRKEPSPSTDILNMLMQARDPQSAQLMQDRQLINEILTLIVAGHETTASTLNWTWYLISQHPEVEEKLSNELNNLTNLPELEDLPKFPYSRQIIEEAMRLYPAGWLMTRKALRDDRLGDYFVPAGTEIYVSPYFIQRHPDLWEDPDRFNPDRFEPDNAKSRHRLAMIPFSAGPRNCIGESLARLEMQIHLLIIAKRLRLRYVQSRPLQLDAGVNLRNKYDFIMHPELKSPATASGQSLA
jgi:cytochrome P450